MDSKIEPIVIVIESPSPIDILDGRFEGEALSAALKLASITSQYFRVENVEMLHECFARICMLTRTKTILLPDRPLQRMVFSPHFHFSAHGNSDGIQLTSGEFIDWEAMRKLLVEFATSTGRINESGESMFAISFSTCNGAQSKRMFSFGMPQPCFAVVGPDDTVAWPDALTAYIVFYHLFITKNKKAQEAVLMMNKSAGLDGVFKPFVNGDINGMAS